MPLLQIELGRHVVKLLRGNGIEARLGGSVAALGYLATRVPEDIDIGILPKSPKLLDGKKELVAARKLVDSMAGKLIRFAASGVWWTFMVTTTTDKHASDFVISVRIAGTLLRNTYDETTFVIGIETSACSVDLQFVNETAFTFMNLTADPGTVAEEKYKEVTGFARLVANSLGRLIQNGGGDAKGAGPSGGDSKGDRARIIEMFRAKMASHNTEKVKRICVKVLWYFKNDTDRGKAAGILGDIVHTIKADIGADQFATEVLADFATAQQVKALGSQLGELAKLLSLSAPLSSSH